MPKTKPRRGHALNKKEKATLKAKQELGMSTYAIAKQTGHAEKTVQKYLREAEAYAEPKMRELVEEIKSGEIADLVVLTTKARSRLHELAPRMNPIEAIALMDRTFQQRRLLEGNSTANIATISKIVQEANNFTGNISRDPDHVTIDIVTPTRNVVDIEEETRK